MANGNLLYKKKVPSEITLGFGLTIKDNLALLPLFSTTNKVIYDLDINNNLQITSTQTTANTLSAIYYSKTENVYWAMAILIPTGVLNVYNSKIVKLNTQGQIVQSFECKNAIPVSDRFILDWVSSSGTGISLSPDGTEIYAIMNSYKRIYRFSTTGTYKGYFNLAGALITDKIGGITSDGQNIWYNTYVDALPGITTIYKATTTGVTLDTFTLNSSNLDFAELKLALDMEYDDQNFPNDTALWLRSASALSSEQYLFAVSVGSKGCSEPPVIIAANKTILLGDTFDPFQGVTASSCDGTDLTNAIVVTQNTVNTSMIGVYSVTYKVTDGQGRETTKTVSVTVALVPCIEPPTIDATDKTVFLGTPFDPLQGVTAHSCDGSNLTNAIIIIENTVNISVLGVYTVIYEVTDAQGRITTKTIIVTVINIPCVEPPTIEATDKILLLGDTFDPLQGVSAQSCNGSNITNAIVIVENQVNVNVVGVYTVIYEVTDAEGRMTVKTIIVTVIDAPCIEPPTINANNQIIFVGSTFDPLEGVSAESCSGVDITNDIIVAQNPVNTAQEGIYLVIYEVTDAEGRTTTKVIIITVIIKPRDSREQAISDIIESVALEQTALSHILNAEGEKIQKALTFDITAEKLLEINASVTSMTDAITRLESILQGKLELFKCSSYCKK